MLYIYNYYNCSTYKPVFWGELDTILHQIHSKVELVSSIWKDVQPSCIRMKTHFSTTLCIISSINMSLFCIIYGIVDILHFSLCPLNTYRWTLFYTEEIRIYVKLLWLPAMIVSLINVYVSSIAPKHAAFATMLYVFFLLCSLSIGFSCQSIGVLRVTGLKISPIYLK